MKKIRKIFILIILTLILLIDSNISFAAGQMQITSDKNVVEAEQEIAVKVELKDVEIAAFTLEIYYDGARLEYISGPENSNNVNNRVIYTWVNENGNNTDKVSIETFKFKAIQDGVGNVAVTGDFYNSNGERVQINNSNLEIKIGKENEEMVALNDNEQNQNVSESNSDLAVLRLSEEGISPDFNKDIKEYYFVTDKAINSIDITAIPANAEATVTIAGNNNLKMGENTIEIKVESKDKSKTSIYKIYVTKTDNIEKANANLETLAVRQGTLEPEFDSNMTKYKVEIANDIDKIDILAVPQKENATVKIIGNGEMKEGDNQIQVVVLAENGTTNKKYDVIVHRRNQEEEQKYAEERKYQAERLSMVLEEEKQNEQNNNNNNEEVQNKSNMIFIVILISIVAIGGIVFINRYKLKNKH